MLSSHTLLDNIYPNKVEDAYYCGGSNETVMPTIYGEMMIVITRLGVDKVKPKGWFKYWLLVGWVGVVGWVVDL